MDSKERDRAEDKKARRLAKELDDWKREHSGIYRLYDTASQFARIAARLRACVPPEDCGLIPELTLGENNTVADLEHYVAGPGVDGMVADENGRLDEERSFRFIDYFSLLAKQRARNNPQPALSSRPVDFIAMCLPDRRLRSRCRQSTARLLAIWR